MIDRLRDEDGFTLFEIMISMVIGLAMFAAVLTIFDSFIVQNRTTELRADAQERARVAADDIARSLRNQVGQSSTQFDRTLPYDLVFRTFDRNPAAGNTNGLSRVRYCLDTTNPANSTFVRQTQTWAGTTLPAMPAGTGCPATGWTTTTTLATGFTNTRDGLDRSLWTYTTATDGGVATTTNIATSIWSRVDPSKAGSEVHLTTGVSLRNSNRPPTASFTVTKQGGTVILNAAPSLDPEGEPLRYTWSLNGTTFAGSQRVEWPFPSGSNTVVLTIRDSGDLSTSTSQTVVMN